MSEDRAFLDTNIFVYLWGDAIDRKTAIAANLVDQIAQLEQGCISAQVAQEFFNVAFNKFPKRMNGAQSDRFLAIGLSVFRWVVVDATVMSRALFLRTRYQLAWYDSLIVAAALHARCATLYSEDFQHGQVFEGSLTVVNPFAVDKS